MNGKRVNVPQVPRKKTEGCLQRGRFPAYEVTIDELRCGDAELVSYSPTDEVLIKPLDTKPILATGAYEGLLWGVLNRAR